MVFERFRRILKKDDEGSQDFIEIDLEHEKSDSKVFVRTYVLRTYEDVNPILNALREGYTIAVIDIKPLKSKDVVELKRAISKLKKTVDALEGRIAGFGEGTVIATPSRVFEIQKGVVQESRSEEIEKF
ncbi:cell division protein SepF [Candidatus Pacearchaeota archaeon]|nr:MAG: cell division protein SepF [Candidatus Pacearchaeota archaeon]